MEHAPVPLTPPRDIQPTALEPSVDRRVSSGSPASYGQYIEIDSADGSGDGLNQWLHYWNVLIRHKLILSLVAVCGAIVAVVVSLFQTPIYVARTTLEFQGPGRQPFEGISFLDDWDPSLLLTQAHVLRSAKLQNRVSSKLSAKGFTAPESTLDSLESIRNWLGLSSPVGTTAAWGRAIGWARSSLTVTLVKDTRIVQIVTESPLPQAAANYANTLAETFIENDQEERWSLYQTTGGWLQRAQDELKAKLEESERQLLAYSGASGLIVTSKADNIGEQRLLDLQTELSKAQGQRIEKEAMYRTTALQPIDARAQTIDGGPMSSSYEVKIADLRQQLADARTTLTEEHPKVRRLQAQIGELRLAQTQEQGNVVNRMRREYEAALRREQQLTADFNEQSKVLAGEDQKLIRYKMLQREVETYRELYDTTMQRGKEASLASALRAVNARLIDPAVPPRTPSSPNLPRNLTLGLMGGLVIGVGLVLLRERTDSTIRTPGASLLPVNLRELGVIPSARADLELSVGAGRKPPLVLPGAVGSGAANGRRVIAEPVELATWNRNGSLLAESVRATVTSILMSGQDKRVILVTSPSPQEGKSTVVTNLAIALAETHRRVLLIDADLRRPRLHAIFGQANTWGLTDLLQDEIPCADYPAQALARKTHVPGLFSLPTGSGGGAGVLPLLHSTRMADLLTRLRSEFDSILIDTPPVLSVADARVLSRYVDAVVLVFRAGQTKREAATTAVNVFEADGTPLLGTVLNDWNPHTMDDGYYSSYSPNYRDASNGKIDAPAP